MKTVKGRKLLPLFALVLGGFALAPGFAATSGQQTEPQAQPPGQSSSPSGMSSQQQKSPAQLMQGKIQQVCQTADKNHDGYISKSEFKSLKKDAKISFKTADVGHKGRLNMQECAKAVSG
jgi:EF hand